ncbi:MAG: hypothetical protein SFV17_18675 [Candidatus Obscuribacter sp.]|nr:hypothetical protein [Candidatus Obscuribacter sp.]
MQIKCHAYSVQKYGDAKEENQDAYSACQSGDHDSPKFFRAVISDGASASVLSRTWAQLIVESYSDPTFEDDEVPGPRLTQLRESWAKIAENHKVPYFAEDKLRTGSFATLTVLKIHAPEDGSNSGKFSAFAIGDSCLFQIRDRRVITQFPLTSGDKFTSCPPLVVSKPNDHDKYLHHHPKIEGQWNSGDEFLLMTDALSCWFLENCIQDARQLAKITSIESCEEFESFIQEQRFLKDDDGAWKMENDDSTMIKVIVHQETQSENKPVSVKTPLRKSADSIELSANKMFRTYWLPILSILSAAVITQFLLANRSRKH